MRAFVIFLNAWAKQAMQLSVLLMALSTCGWGGHKAPQA
jgi:hypothetical protein